MVEPTWTSVHVAYRVGSRHPLDRGAAGRAILAARLPAPHDPYVLTEDELQPGARGIAAPVPAMTGTDASVGVVSLAPLEAASVGPRVVEAAADVGRCSAGAGDAQVLDPSAYMDRSLSESVTLCHAGVLRDPA